MDNAFHLIIKQADYPESVLTFPAGATDKVRNLFQEKYQNGKLFLDDYIRANKTMLDAVVSDHDQLSFKYFIDLDEKLAIELYGANGQDYKPKVTLDLNNINAILKLFSFWTDYVLTKGTIDSTDGPVTVKKILGKDADLSDFDEKVTQALDNSWAKHNQYGRVFETPYVKLEVKLLNGN